MSEGNVERKQPETKGKGVHKDRERGNGGGRKNKQIKKIYKRKCDGKRTGKEEVKIKIADKKKGKKGKYK